MITEKDLQEAIAECEGQRNPNANTCIKLAAFYTIRNELFPHDNKLPDLADFRQFSGYSHDSVASEQSNNLQYDSGSEFSDVINGKNIEDVLPVMDELMESVQIISPRLYDSVIYKLNDL